MADDLRIVARWEDQGISKGLEKLRNDLVLTTKVPGLDDIRKRFSDIEGTITKLRQTGAQLNSAGGLAGMLGIGNLTGIASVAGLAASMRDLARTQVEMRHFSRETGIAAGHLRELQALGKRFQIDPEAMTGAASGFADKMNDIRRGLGSTYGEIAQKAPQLAKELRESTDNFEALGKVLGWLEKQGNPIDQKRWAQEFDLGPLTRLFTDGPKALREAWKDVLSSGVGKPNPELEKQSKALVDAMTRFDSSVEAMKRTWGPSLLGEMASAVDRLSGSFGKFAEAWEKLRSGHPLDALKTIDGATDLGLGKDRPAGTIQDGIRGDAAPLMLKQAELQRQIQVLEEQIARKESVPDPLGEGHAVATDERQKRDRLIDETKKLGDEIKRLREDQSKRAQDGDAIKQGVSYGGAGGGLGGLIQRASFGGGFGGGGFGGGGGGGFGPDSPYGAGLQPFRRFRGEGGGGDRPPPGVGASGPIPGIPARDMRNVNPEFAEYIRKSAIAHRIDPNAALRIANAEGLRGSNPNRLTPGDFVNGRATSFGPFQLHYGGRGSLGTEYTRATGHHAGDPQYWQEQIDFALKHASKHGWRAWNGRFGARLGVWDGIGRQAMAEGDANGLRLKGGEATAGGPSAKGLTDFLKRVQDEGLPGGFDRVTALNDAFHHRVNPRSMHTRGLAGDVTLRDARRSAEAAEAIRARLRAAGLRDSDFQVRDEYLYPSGHATGGHIHTQFNTREAAERYRAYAEAQRKREAGTANVTLPEISRHVPAKDAFEAYRADRERRARAGEIPGEEEDDAKGFKNFKAGAARRAEVLADPNDERRRSGELLARARRAGVMGGSGATEGGAHGHINGTITLNGFPAGTKADFAGGGVVREVKLNRGSTMAGAEA